MSSGPGAAAAGDGLAAEVLRILEAEAGYPPLSSPSLGRVLRCLSYSPEPAIMEIEDALGRLVHTGQVECVWSPRLGARYRAVQAPRASAAPKSEDFVSGVMSPGDRASERSGEREAEPRGGD